MKLRASISQPVFGGSSSRARAFTLAEILIAMAIFILVIGGILSAHIFGLRMFQVNQTNLNTTEWSRNTFWKFADEVRSCNTLSIGNYSTNNGVFTGLMDGEVQQGNSLLIYPTTDTNRYILYFVAGDMTFQRITEEPADTLILAHSVTNSVVFSARSYAGDILTGTTSSTNPVIHLTLDFLQPESFMLQLHQYKLETSVTRHASP